MYPTFEVCHSHIGLIAVQETEPSSLMKWDEDPSSLVQVASLACVPSTVFVEPLTAADATRAS